jgi:hypothetical protein
MFATILFPVLALVWFLPSPEGFQSTDSQKTPARSAYQRQPGVELREIRVDERCRILLEEPSGYDEKAEGNTDDAVCHLESQHTSNHVEKPIVEGVPTRSSVTIEEQEYVLQDVTDEPVAFVVEQAVKPDWTVDSDPQPTKIFGNIAEFRVLAEPGQIVRLHVGLRHAEAKPMK